MARQEQEDLLLPFIDEEEHDQYEDSLYMNPFVKALVRLALMPLSNTSSPPNFEDNSSESTEDDLDTLVNNMSQLDFEDSRIKKKVNKIAQAI